MTRTLPSGAPKWITPDLLRDTVEIWQPYYAEELTDAESLEILLTVSRIFDTLQNHDQLEK